MLVLDSFLGYRGGGGGIAGKWFGWRVLVGRLLIGYWVLGEAGGRGGWRGWKKELCMNLWWRMGKLGRVDVMHEEGWLSLVVSS